MTTFEKITDEVDVTSLGRKPDLQWVYTDAAGHVHRRSNYDGTNHHDPYPTLKWVWEGEPYYCDLCQEDHRDGHYECPVCHQHVSPGMLPPGYRRETVPGIIHFLIDGKEVTEEDYKERLAIAIESGEMT